MKNIIRLVNRKHNKSTVYLNKRIIGHISFNQLMNEWCINYNKELIYGNTRDDVIDMLLERIYDGLQNK